VAISLIRNGKKGWGWALLAVLFTILVFALVAAARTGDGSITAQGTPTAEWKLNTSSGNVTVNLPAEVGFDIEAHTSSGDIRIEQAVRASRCSDHRLACFPLLLGLILDD
jgi:hypothetical protein